MCIHREVRPHYVPNTSEVATLNVKGNVLPTVTRNKNRLFFHIQLHILQHVKPLVQKVQNPCTFYHTVSNIWTFK